MLLIAPAILYSLYTTIKALLISDDPHRDFAAMEHETRHKHLTKPVCCICKCRIQSSGAYHFDARYICQDCVDEAWTEFDDDRL